MPVSPREVTLIPGDGIGPEVVEAAVRVVEEALRASEGETSEIAWRRVEAGADVFSRTGSPMPDAVLSSIRETGVALKGPIGTPIGGGFRSANVLLRQALELYACVRPVKSIPGLETPFPNVDLVIVRENTEDLYAGLEHEVTSGVVTGLKVVTETASLRIARFAFELARRQGRRRVHVVHKANIMKLSDGLFLECARRIAVDFPDVELCEIIIDNCAMQLAMRPQQFDVLLLGNLYGDIVSDLCAGLVGGLGVVPGANFGEGRAVFEAVHGSAPDIAGKGLANPSAVVLSAARMLEHLGEREAAARVERGVHAALSEPSNRTADLGGVADLQRITEAILEHVA